MDDNNLFVLLIQKDPAGAAIAREALSEQGEGRAKLQWVDSLPPALARLGGGGVDLVVLDLTLREEPASEGLTAFLQVKHAAGHAPIVVLYDPSDEGLALRAMRAGAADSVLKQTSGDGIAVVVASAVQRARKPPGAHGLRAVAPQPSGAALAFIGAKGGVGSTTAALNVAAALAKHNQVILVEMRPAFGTLQPYLKPHGLTGNISHRLRAEAGEEGSCLWPCKSVPGLSILFGPQTAAECGELPPDRVKKLVHDLAGLADYVVLDLPASLSAANRAAIAACNRVVLVMERDPVCVQSAKLMAQAIEAWEGTPQPVEMMVVNRALLSCPMPLGEVEAQLGFPPLAVVPPGPDVCLGAQQAHVPVIVFQPDCLVADSLIGLAEKCASFMRTVPMVA